MAYSYEQELLILVEIMPEENASRLDVERLGLFGHSAGAGPGVNHSTPRRGGII